ncbi:hypothetical protein CWN38_04585 [Klebsiella pneumoniae]|nr:hypothetical protein CWN67_02995 [Klebsiella pneumoniae]PLO29667.1 hypothetical protein CWN38_04585 [Klebsiella pneumoniae]
MDSVHHIWCPLSSQEYQDLPDGAETTLTFNLASVGDIDSVDDLLIDNVARFLLKGWEGVGQLVDGSEVALDYTPELGIAMLKQYPDLYWLILAEAASIAQGKEQQTQETVKKP